MTEQNPMLGRTLAREKPVPVSHSDWRKQGLKPECPSSLMGSPATVCANE